MLDFGLAKAMEPAYGSRPTADGNDANSPTITSPAMTAMGVILGTTAYMSPEQARGKTVDRRADIWAFGCVLYEMLTGTRAFAGDSVSEVLASVLAREPEWTRLPATLAPALRTFITRGLHKDPRQRIHDIADVRLALDGAFETAAPPPTAATSSASQRPLAWMAAFAVAALLVAALAIPAARHLRETPPPTPPETRLDIVTPATDEPRSFALSPDGRQIVFVASGEGASRLWLRSLATTTAQPLAGTEGARLPFWSPDGTRIGFRSYRTGHGGGLYQKLTSGAGVEERLVALAIPTSWSADGRFVLYHSADPQTGADLWVVPMAGDHTPSVVLKTPFREAFGAFSPDGRWVAYQSNESGRPEIYVRPFVPPGAAGTGAGAAGGQWQVSTAGGIMPVWRPDGKELYYLNPAGAMMAAPITVTGATLAPGAPMVLFPTRIVGGGADVQVGRNYDVAPDGRFLINTEVDSAAAPITLIQHWNPEAQK